MAESTRERILAVASELFIEQGYDATTLREIADRLGFTKAALYYHFASKEELLAALVAPAEALIDEVLARLESAHDVQQWARALEWVVGEVFAHRSLFLLLERNHAALAHLESFHEAHHQAMHRRVEAAARRAGTTLGEQVRMVAAVGAVTGFDDWAPGLLADEDPDVLHAELTAAVRDILGLRPRTRRRSAV